MDFVVLMVSSVSTLIGTRNEFQGLFVCLFMGFNLFTFLLQNLFSGMTNKMVNIYVFRYIIIEMKG